MQRPMIDFRLYRLAFLPTLIALVVLMFSLEGAPEPIEPATPPGTFEGERAASQARQIAALAPERQPGSAGDEEIADLVTERFREIPAGAVTQQTFEASFEGDDVTLRNVVLTLPGEAGSTVVILAARDSARGPGAASSAAATGVLIELASALGVAGHEKTYVLASTSGSAAGATGAAELLEDLPERDAVEAAIVISQPGAAEPRPPFVVTSSTAETSGPVQLERTAELAVEAQAEQRSNEPAAFTQLARLAIPSGLGGQAPLVAEGVNAIAISAASERPLPESEDTPDQLSGSSIDEFGRAIQSTVGAVDIATAELVHGPDAYLELSDNLVPGWTLAVLALALLLPAAVAAFDACARGVRRSAGLGAGVAWAAARSLPFVGALAVLYGLTIVGAVPDPPFPFDPELYGLGSRAAVTIVVMVIAAGASAFALRALGITAGSAPAASRGRAWRRCRRRLPRDLAREPVPGAAARPDRARLAARRCAPEPVARRRRRGRLGDRLPARCGRPRRGRRRARARRRRALDLPADGGRRSDRACRYRSAVLYRRCSHRRNRAGCATPRPTPIHPLGSLPQTITGRAPGCSDERLVGRKSYRGRSPGSRSLPMK